MSPNQWRNFLLTGTRTAKVAVVRADGRPHVVPVWFLLDGDDVIFTTWHESVKGRALQHDSRLCLCVDEDRPPFSYVMIEGHARISQDAVQREFWAKEIAARYMGKEQAEAYGARNAVEGELLIRIAIEHVVALADIAE